MGIPELFEKLPVNVKKVSPVSGGDSNQAYFLGTEKDKFFIKINQKKLYPEMFIKEVHGLNALNHTGYIKTPKVIASGEIDQTQYLLLEWVGRGEPENKTWENFGHELANMHKVAQSYFGFSEDNYIGTLQQINTPCNNWAEFYGHYHLMPLIKILKDQNKIESKEVKNTERLCLKLSEIFPMESPSLVHGDLWSGNYIISEQKEIVLIDPAVYNAHREIDIAMTKLFGGFPSYFYGAYNETYPLEKNWEHRLEFSQLYPLLIHAILFGGNYVTEAQKILKKFQ